MLIAYIDEVGEAGAFRVKRQKVGLNDKKCGIFFDFSLLWCGKVGVEVGLGQLGGWTKCVASRRVFPHNCAVKSVFKLACLPGGYESTDLPCL